MRVGFPMRYPIFLAVVLLCPAVFGQAANQASGNAAAMPGMSGQDMSAMKDMPPADEKDASGSSAMLHTMEGHMDMGPHMKMTELRAPKPGDAERAKKVAEAARRAAEKYRDYHTALADGFHIFLPNVPQPVYHFTNSSYAVEAQLNFNPDHPTSLLYEKHGDDYKLIGVMYTAPKHFSEDDLDARIPLSVAQWHEHVNFCKAPGDMPRAEKWQKMLGPNAEFGLKGSIHTQEACDAAGGTFLPVVFNWMVHVYPFEKDQASIWSVDRQHGDAD